MDMKHEGLTGAERSDLEHAERVQGSRADSRRVLPPYGPEPTRPVQCAAATEGQGARYAEEVGTSRQPTPHTRPVPPRSPRTHARLTVGSREAIPAHLRGNPTTMSRHAPWSMTAQMHSFRSCAAKTGVSREN